MLSVQGQERYYEIHDMVNIAMQRTAMSGLQQPGDQDYVLWLRCRQFHGDDEVEYEALKAILLHSEINVLVVADKHRDVPSHVSFVCTTATGNRSVVTAQRSIRNSNWPYQICGGPDSYPLGCGFCRPTGVALHANRNPNSVTIAQSSEETIDSNLPVRKCHGVM
jgi:hypothetical protein